MGVRVPFSANAPQPAYIMDYAKHRHRGFDVYLITQGPFQFALPRGERRLHRHMTSYASRFNSRSRVGSDCRIIVGTLSVPGFQFALPRGERLKGGSCRDNRPPVSIRAPAWGATHECQQSF